MRKGMMILSVLGVFFTPLQIIYFHEPVFPNVIMIPFYFIAAVFLSRWPKRCKVCHKWFGMRKGKTRFVDSEPINITVEVARKNLQGVTIGYNDQVIQGSLDSYQTAYTCKYCGAVRFLEKVVESKHM